MTKYDPKKFVKDKNMLHVKLAGVRFHRAINSQRFLEFTREDLRKREEKHQQALKALEPHRKQLTKQDADKFFDRLMDDTEKRKKNR